MHELTITIEEDNSGDGYQYNVYTCDAMGASEGMDSVDGGLCTGTIEDALEMANEAAKKVMSSNRANPQFELVEKLLDIIDNAEGMTRDDLQGAVQAFVVGNCN